LYSSSTQVTGTDTIATNSVTTELTTSTKVQRYGFKPTTTVTAAFDFQHSTDGITWTTAESLASQEWVAGEWYWFDLDPTIADVFFRISSVTAFALDEFYLASSIVDTPMTQFSRDEYAQQTHKTYSQRPCTNYYFEKTVTPSLTLWPVPNNSYDQLSVWRYRYVQDVGTLTTQIEVPQQWLEAVIWMLASRLAFEVPGIDPQRRGEVISASQAFVEGAELSETDNSPIFWSAGVSVYTR